MLQRENQLNSAHMQCMNSHRKLVQIQIKYVFVVCKSYKQPPYTKKYCNNILYSIFYILFYILYSNSLIVNNKIILASETMKQGWEINKKKIQKIPKSSLVQWCMINDINLSRVDAIIYYILWVYLHLLIFSCHICLQDFVYPFPRILFRAKFY